MQFLGPLLLLLPFSLATPPLRPRQAQPYTLPPLPYSYSALEPYISAEIMTIHHDRHHATYVSNLNIAITSLNTAIAANNLTAILAAQSAINFNGGGHINHSLFWQNLSPNGTAPGDNTALRAAVTAKWGTVQAFTEAFNAKLGGLQGSGWGWLVKNADGGLEVVVTANQDPVLAPQVPLIGIDAWEHSYYLQYKNDRAAYFKSIWNVVNWETAERRFAGTPNEFKVQDLVVLTV